jgi:hypothetical protein
MKKVEASIAEVGEEIKRTNTNSPPSGKRETDMLGKVSTDQISPQATANIGMTFTNGHVNGEKNGDTQKSGESENSSTGSMGTTTMTTSNGNSTSSD